MTENDSPNPLPEANSAAGDRASEYAAAVEAAWQATVRTLTDAVRLTHPQYGPPDVADFLASALAAVAANLGSVERAARRPAWVLGG